MREVELDGSAGDLASASFRACLATILELPAAEIPQLGGEDPAGGGTISRWLGELGLGLVRLADSGTFAWPGPWLGVVGTPDRRFVVMYGVPSGVVWDPAGDGPVERGSIEEGFLVAAADIALARPPMPAAPAAGVVAEIWVAPKAGTPARRLESARALAGRGLEGDRYATGAGTFASGVPGSALTLIEAEVCAAFTPPLAPDEHRRNVITSGIDLNALVGREFLIGTTRCRGMRLCEPCTVSDSYATRPILRALVHRGGLRAEILEDGEIRAGDEVSPPAEPQPPSG